MTLITLIRITGIFGILGFLFHMAFPFMPDWKPAFDAMPRDVGYILTTFFYVQFAFLGGIAYISTFQAKKLLNNPLRNSLAVLFASFYLVRIFTEFTLWKFHVPQSLIILPFCLLPVVCYLSLLFYPKNEIVQ